MRTDKRAAGIIVKDGKVLVFRRFRNGRWYHAFIGGGVEEDETPEQGMIREVKEELCIEVIDYKLLFTIELEQERNVLYNIEKAPGKVQQYSRYQYFYLVTRFEGEPELGGPEKERHSENNQYHLEWIPLDKIEQTADLYPVEAREKLVELIKSGKLER